MGVAGQDGPTRLIAYTRVSTEEQARDGLSLAAQRTRLEAYVTAQGAELVGVVSDDGVSGKVAPHLRPGLAQALASVRRGQADGIVALKLDRLSRSTRDVLDLADACQREGWRLCSVYESLDTGTAGGRFVLTILAALAQMEREQIGERTREAMAQVAREGRVRSGRLPFGYRTRKNPGSVNAVAGDRSELVEHESEQLLLRSMLELTDAGLGARRIARELNAQGGRNPRTDQPWRPSTVQKILSTATRTARAA